MSYAQNQQPRKQTVVCFDGVCLFCSGLVRFVHKRDEHDLISFAALQSEPGRKLLSEFPVAPESSETLIVIEGDCMYTGSDAALLIARRLDRYWPLLYFLKIIPQPIRDFLYRQFARRRYAWFGKSQTCFTPDGSLREKFFT